LTAQELEVINAALAGLGSYESPISASDAHTAMEYYLFAPSAEALSELSTLSLAHLYFVKVQAKPAGYGDMDANEKQSWNRSRMQTIRKKPKSRLIEALVEVVRAPPTVSGYYN
jgi:hypothetical protein